MYRTDFNIHSDTILLKESKHYTDNELLQYAVRRYKEIRDERNEACRLINKMVKALKKHSTKRDLKLYDFIVAFITLPREKKEAFRNKYETQVLLSEIEALKKKVEEQENLIKTLENNPKNK